MLGCELQTLELTQMKFLNFADNEEAFIECLKSLSDLKHLNLSDNKLSPHLLQRIVTTIFKNEKMNLITLNLSRNEMPPATVQKMTKTHFSSWAKPELVETDTK